MGSKSYQTWLVTDLAVSVASGIEWLGRRATAGRVVYVNLEIQRAFYQKQIVSRISTAGLRG
jgi:RecA-family ATPase